MFDVIKRTGLGLNKKELQEKKDVEMNRDTVATVT